MISRPTIFSSALRRRQQPDDNLIHKKCVSRAHLDCRFSIAQRTRMTKGGFSSCSFTGLGGIGCIRKLAWITNLDRVLLIVAVVCLEPVGCRSSTTNRGAKGCMYGHREVSSGVGLAFSLDPEIAYNTRMQHILVLWRPIPMVLPTWGTCSFSKFCDWNSFLSVHLL
jgi:hypothetical protein